MARARRDKLTPDIQEKVVQSIGFGATYEVAATYAGIRRETIWRWMKRGESERSGRYRTFADAVKTADGKSAVQALVAIRTAAKGSWQANAWLLERRYPDQYGRGKIEVKTDGKVEHHHTGSVGFDFSKYTDQELDALEQLLAKQDAETAAPAGNDDVGAEGREGAPEPA
jgi:transposase